MSSGGEEPWTGLCLSESLPLEFRPDPEPPAPASLAEADVANFQTLIVDASLRESRRGLEPTELDANRQSDIERLECKVDVLLVMVARLATIGAGALASRPVRLFAQGLEWQAGAGSPAAGTRGVVLLQVNPGFAQRLTLYGVVAGEQAGPGGPWVRFRFEGVGERVVEMLERLIFRQHRRQVAGAHGQGTAGG